MKPSGNRPEVIILGSGLGGLVAGTLLSKNNHSVLLLKERGYQSSYTLRGYRFEPFSNFSEKLLKPNLLEKISQSLNLSLGRTQEEGKQASISLSKSRQAAGFQVILPKARVDIFPHGSLFQKEWKREFPQELGRVEEFYNQLNQIQHPFQRGNGKNVSASYFPLRQRSFITRIFSFDPFPKEKMDQKLRLFSREFREFIQLQLISWGNLHSDRFPISLAAHILLHDENGSNPDLDLGKLEGQISNQFLKYGGRVEEIERVRKVDTTWRKGLTLSLEGDPRAFGCQSLILNSPLHRISSIMDKKTKELSKWQKKVKPMYVMIPLFLGIREKGIPVGMKDLLISILDLEKPYDDGNVLFLSLSAKGDETRAPEGKRALTVESLMNAEKWGQTLLVDYQQGVMKHLCHLFPFLESEIEFVDFKWASDHIRRWSYPHFLYEATSDFRWVEEVIPTRMTRNIYFVGKENFPPWGLAGEIFSGLTVGQRILKKYS
ncbi:MAG: FAD-dependent oxidoreductase [Thermodesulfobacteriota bacterium]